jgi:2-polyprenyl-3-methyl-5-hydroxy-6-metoxy-1,4-benzoquinol methylase
MIANFLKRFRDKKAKVLVVKRSSSASSALTPEPEIGSDREQVYTWIKHNINCFKEWYQPVDFGNGIAAHVTRPPDWRPRPDLLYANDGGIAKWNYIVKKHIPDVRGKRVLDLGCSSGVYSIELVRMGATEVIGIDRNEEIRHRSTDTPPPQDVIAQAKFVKRSFELLDGVEYPITYMAYDIGRLQELNLGRFDLIIALCVVYHELDGMPRLLHYLSTLTDHLILQANQGHSGELGRWSDRLRHAELLLDAGFTDVAIDAPSGFLQPMVIGRKDTGVK